MHPKKFNKKYKYNKFEVSVHNLSRFECPSIPQKLSSDVQSSTRSRMYVVAYYIVFAMRNESTIVNSKKIQML